ncbi:hypothetical protein HPT29_025460 (plasmid) [Microvirga terrae]|uniref:Uncharacterized protein n=1 Tax=Microvirga terrae TaxID=2740529 RepID=A0ABY5S063_9HYPH|nr:hypothetical protein [Microvirga terrae]UVF22502.1 hypothetical protein HPT29_025460 [Microvirga terrae]
MLRKTEDIPTTLTRELDPLERLIAQVQEPLPSHEFTLTDSFIELIEESLARGWIYSTALQELIAAMDPRLAGFAVDALAQIFDFEEVQVWANSTRSMPTRSHGAVAMRNAAFLLIQLKAMGFQVDDAPLSARMRPLLASKKVLVGREFYVFWQQELEGKREAFVLYTAPSSPTATAKDVTLPLGHTMRVISDGTRPIGIEVRSPLSTKIGPV